MVRLGSNPGCPWIAGTWDNLARFVDDGRIEIDTNIVKRTMGPIVLGHENHLFVCSVGAAESWAFVASMIQSAKLADAKHFACLENTLEPMVQEHLISRLNQLRLWWAISCSAVD